MRLDCNAAARRGQERIRAADAARSSRFSVIQFLVRMLCRTLGRFFFSFPKTGSLKTENSAACAAVATFPGR
jgi:hypothetical protein